MSTHASWELRSAFGGFQQLTGTVQILQARAIAEAHNIENTKAKALADELQAQVEAAAEKAAAEEVRRSEEQAAHEARLSELQSGEKSTVRQAITRLLQLVYFSKVCFVLACHTASPRQPGGMPP